MTTYWRSPAGAFFTLEPGDGGSPGWTSITHAGYIAGLAAAEAATQAEIDLNIANACLQRKAAYNALKASAHTDDWPESLFFFLTKFTPGDC